MMVFLINNRKMTIRVRHILFFAVSLFCISCSDDAPVSSVREYPIEVYLGCDMTKVGIDGNDLFWESGDQVAFRATDASGNSSVAVLTLNDVDSGLGKAKFKGSVEMNSDPVKCEFAYPANAFSMTDDKTVFDYSEQDGTHKPYLYGRADYSEDGMDCILEHVGGMIRLTVAEGVTSVTLSSNSGEYATLTDGSTAYSGQLISKVVLDEDGTILPAADADYVIEASVPSSDNAVCLFMPAMEFTDGFTIVCHKGEDGPKMFRSFSKTGTNYSPYSFASGIVIDLDMSEFVGFSADCTVSAEHTYTDGILDGTSVKITDFKYEGAPAKIIDNWGVAVYYADNNFVRWKSAPDAYDDKEYELSDYTTNWPLLFPGDNYKVYAICQINGQTLQFESSTKLIVPDDLKITITPIAETSWSYRNTPDKANATDNSSIVRLGLSVSVSNDILNHTVTDYGFKARLQNTTTGDDSGELKMNSNFTGVDGLNVAYNPSVKQYELKDGNGLFVLSSLDWRVHNITALVIFNGKSYSASTKAYVTGLPYRHDFRADQGLDGGKIVGSRTKYYTYNGYELNYYETFVGRKVNVFYSRTFSLPENTSVKYNTSFSSLNTGQAISKFNSTIYTGLVTSESPSKTTSKTITSDTTGNIDDASGAAASTIHVLTGTGTMNSATFVSASAESSDKMFMVECVVYLGGLEILYNKP